VSVVKLVPRRFSFRDSSLTNAMTGAIISSMRSFTFVPVIVLGGSLLVSTGFGVNVTQHHNDYMRDGLYIDPAFTFSAASNLTRDLSFNGTVSGNVYAQPLYLDNGPAGRAVVIAVTESNNVYALDAVSGNVVWQDHLGTPVPTSKLPCGDINPLGITGTPVVDLTNDTLFVNAMTTPNGGTTEQNLIYALNLDTGATNAGWPVNVSAIVPAFTPSTQQQRGALAVLDGYVYVPYGGLYGDCGTYHGWLVGVQENNPANVLAWATSANGGGAWGVGGVASDDGIHPYIATGNTFGASSWSGGEAIVRFQPGPVFSGLTNDYWAPTNWLSLDGGDLDIGDCAPLIVNVPGATPSELVVAVGKDGYVYLLNQTNLSGVSPPVARSHFGSGQMPQAVAAYKTAVGTYIVCRSGTTSLNAFQITAANPPAIVSAWTETENGEGSPFVTSTDGTNNSIVWLIGSEGDQKLHGYNGQTGAVIFNGGGANELMSGTVRFNTGIAARGRIYVANNNKVYAFGVPVPPVILANSTTLPDGVFQFGFTNTPGLSFTVYSTTNLFLSFTNWTQLGTATEISPGQFQFADSTVINHERFYRVVSP
jgi:PQQ enzyme repeat